MSNVEKLSIAITHDMAVIVRKAVESGDYASSSEVVRDALRDWKLKRSSQQSEVNKMRQLWQEGIESGAGRFSNMGAIKKEAQKRFSVNSFTESE